MSHVGCVGTQLPELSPDAYRAPISMNEFGIQDITIWNISLQKESKSDLFNEVNAIGEHYVKSKSNKGDESYIFR